ncbi:MAG: hypothetical protein HRF49_10050 [bacterium]|jgi:hypothetical protein
MKRRRLYLLIVFAIGVIVIVLHRAGFTEPVTVVSEYTLTAEELTALSDKFGTGITAGFYNVYRAGEFQYQLNFLKCKPSDVDALMEAVRLTDQRATLVKSSSGIYEVITPEAGLARRVILALPDVSKLEQAKIIPPQLPGEWMLTGEHYSDSKELKLLEEKVGPGIVQALNQVFLPGVTKRVVVNYLLCDSAEHAQMVYATVAARKSIPGSTLRFGTLVIEIVSDDESRVKDIRRLFVTES